MKILIAGSGGTGGCIGGFLAYKGFDVTFIARGVHLDKMKHDGLKIKSGLKGEITVSPVKACESNAYNEKADVIFLCTKSYSIDEIIPLLRKASHKDTIIIPIINGIGIGDEVNEKFSDAIILDGCIYIASFIAAPGEIIHLGKGFRIVYGPRKDQTVPNEKLQEIKEVLLSSGIDAVVSDNIKRDTFQKFSFVSAFAACGAYYNITAKDIQENPEYRNMFTNLITEVLDIAKAMDLSFNVDLLPVNLNIIDTLLPDTTSSLQKDLFAGKKTEMDGLIFEVVRLGVKYGVPTPNYSLVAKKFGFPNQ